MLKRIYCWRKKLCDKIGFAAAAATAQSVVSERISHLENPCKKVKKNGNGCFWHNFIDFRLVSQLYKFS